MQMDELYATALEIRLLTVVVAKTARQALEQRPELSRAGVGGLQYKILHVLSCRQHTLTELSRRFMLDPSTLVPAVDSLEGKGLLRRGRDPDDRRRVPLSLTEEGKELVSRIPVIDGDDPLVKGLGALGDEKTGQLLTLLRGLARQLPEGERILEHVSSLVNLQITGEPLSSW
jgi:DNA-binding MarR family transcriptional regulator